MEAILIYIVVGEQLVHLIYILLPVIRVRRHPVHLSITELYLLWGDICPVVVGLVLDMGLESILDLLAELGKSFWCLHFACLIRFF